MLGLSAPVRGAIAASFVTLAGLAGYNLTQRPTTQTVEGIDNTTLIVIAGVGGLFIWLNAGR